MSTQISVYPCDRGMPGGGVRGLHHFQAGVGGVVACIYCGQSPARILATLGDDFERRDYAAIAGRSPNRAWLFMLLDGKDPTDQVWLTLRPSGEDRPLSLTEATA